MRKKILASAISLAIALCSYRIYSALTTFTNGPSNALTGVNQTGIGTGAWATPGNVTLSDNAYATVSIIASNSSNYLKATNFQFAVPSGSTIIGIQANIEKASEGGSTLFFDNSVKIVKGGVIVGTDLKKAPAWSTTDTASIYGDATNLWGVTAWTAQDINRNNFGVVISVVNNEIISIFQAARVDQVQMTVTYEFGSVLYKSTLYAGRIQ